MLFQVAVKPTTADLLATEAVYTIDVLLKEGRDLVAKDLCGEFQAPIDAHRSCLGLVLILIGLWRVTSRGLLSLSSRLHTF